MSAIKSGHIIVTTFDDEVAATIESVNMVIYFDYKNQFTHYLEATKIAKKQPSYMITFLDPNSDTKDMLQLVDFVYSSKHGTHIARVLHKTRNWLRTKEQCKCINEPGKLVVHV